jgi:hypothetical protein
MRRTQAQSGFPSMHENDPWGPLLARPGPAQQAVTCNEFVTKERVHHKGTKDSKTDFLTEDSEGNEGTRSKGRRLASDRAMPTLGCTENRIGRDELLLIRSYLARSCDTLVASDEQELIPTDPQPRDHRSALHPS